jgi:hypothetical protein
MEPLRIWGCGCAAIPLLPQYDATWPRIRVSNSVISVCTCCDGCGVPSRFPSMRWTSSLSFGSRSCGMSWNLVSLPSYRGSMCIIHALCGFRLTFTSMVGTNSGRRWCQCDLTLFHFKVKSLPDGGIRVL